MDRRSARWLSAIAAAAVICGAAACGTEDGGAEADGALTMALETHAAGRLDEAVALYEDVLDDDPANKFAHYNLGLIHQIRRSGRAEAHYREALHADAGFVPALFNLAILRADGGDSGEALELYRRVIAIEPEHASARLNLGFLLRQIGRQEEGNAELARATELDPSLENRIPPSPTPEGPAAP